MALGDPYGQLPEFKIRLGIEDQEDDTRAESALLVASRDVNKYCRRQFNTDDAVTTRRFWIDNPEYAIIDDFHTSTGLVVELGDIKNDFSTTWTIDVDFWISPLNGTRNEEPEVAYWRIETMSGQRIPCPSGRQPNLRVAANWGWSAVPNDVVEATYLRGMQIFRRNDSPEGVIAGFEGNPVRVSRFKDPDIESMLKDYRKHVPGRL